MSKASYWQRGETLDYKNTGSSTIEANTVVELTGRVGIAGTDIAPGAEGDLHVCGVFEFDNFTAGSRAIAEAIAKATKNGAFSLIGGGDSVACINKFGMADQVSYISTGGGALLEAIEGKILPGVAAIKGE